ncbi:uncharacterized protein CEXT_382281 [Caerostris extrusa]|uniref:Ig-like domain-containing protein n=1 Tax=Caerostris extrusa TaxID=172846 RepID=A0AAV4Q3P7_CAEEX|nr:uncharacterized protein CEXT_382281 [Caerostris extrusa]
MINSFAFCQNNGIYHLRDLDTNATYIHFPPLTHFLCSIFPGREHAVLGFIGDSAVLPCEVDLPSCGKVYFITWTKNVSNEWKREYLYSDGVARAMGDFSGPERATFSLNNHSAHLRLHGLTVQDEGTYKCDVTYVRGKCPSLSFYEALYPE